MTLKEIYALLKEIEDQVEDTCCAVTMDPLDIKDLITKLRIAIHEYSKENNTK
jgi:AmiR/NasT family two-component response regulator